MRIRSLALKNGDAAVEAVGDIVNKLLALFAYDVADIGVVNAVQDEVNDSRNDEHCDDCVHCALDLVEDDGEREDYDRVGQQNKSAEVNVRILKAHELCYDIRAAGRGSRVVNDAHAQSLDSAAYDTGKEHIIGRTVANECKQIDKHGRKHHSHERADDEFRSELTPRDDEQRDIENDVHNADGKVREVVYNHRNTADAADDYRVRVQKKLKSRGEQCAAYDNEHILPNIILCFNCFHIALLNRP